MQYSGPPQRRHEQLPQAITQHPSSAQVDSRFKSGWNYLDACVIAVEIVSWANANTMALDPAFMRVVRLSKVLRIVRVLRNQGVLESLHFLMVCLQASGAVLFWSAMVFLIIQLVAAMILSQLLESTLMQPSSDVELQRQLFRYYGTYWRVTLGSLPGISFERFVFDL